VKPKRSGGPPAPAMSGGSFAREDAAEYSQMRHELIETVEKLGGYEPPVDDIHIDMIVRHLIYLRKIETFLNTKTATEYTYASVADSKVKLEKIIENAIRELAISRRDRLTSQTQTILMTELREAMLRGLRNAGEPDR
jgi:hypothetical protein